MRYDILTNYFGQHVEVTTISKTFNGVMRQAEVDGGFNDVVEIEPVNEYQRKRFGATVIEVDIIKSIKPVKPFDPDLDMDLGEKCSSDDDCCDDMSF